MFRSGGSVVSADQRRTSYAGGALNAVGAVAGGAALWQTMAALQSGSGSWQDGLRATYVGMGVAHQSAELSAYLATRPDEGPERSRAARCRISPTSGTTPRSFTNV